MTSPPKSLHPKSLPSPRTANYWATVPSCCSCCRPARGRPPCHWWQGLRCRWDAGFWDSGSRDVFAHFWEESLKQTKSKLSSSSKKQKAAKKNNRNEERFVKCVGIKNKPSGTNMSCLCLFSQLGGLFKPHSLTRIWINPDLICQVVYPWIQPCDAPSHFQARGALALLSPISLDCVAERLLLAMTSFSASASSSSLGKKWKYLQTLLTQRLYYSFPKNQSLWGSWFMSRGFDRGRISSCLAKQIGGSPAVYLKRSSSSSTVQSGALHSVSDSNS